MLFNEDTEGTEDAFKHSQHCMACDRRPAIKTCIRCGFTFCDSHCRTVPAGVICLWCITDEDYLFDPDDTVKGSLDPTILVAQCEWDAEEANIVTPRSAITLKSCFRPDDAETFPGEVRFDTYLIIYNYHDDEDVVIRDSLIDTDDAVLCDETEDHEWWSDSDEHTIFVMPGHRHVHETFESHDRETYGKIAGCAARVKAEILRRQALLEHIQDDLGGSDFFDPTMMSKVSPAFHPNEWPSLVLGEYILVFDQAPRGSFEELYNFNLISPFLPRIVRFVKVKNFTKNDKNPGVSPWSKRKGLMNQHVEKCKAKTMQTLSISSEDMRNLRPKPKRVQTPRASSRPTVLKRRLDPNNSVCPPSVYAKRRLRMFIIDSGASANVMCSQDRNGWAQYVRQLQTELTFNTVNKSVKLLAEFGGR